jgi:hypothetical protein
LFFYVVEFKMSENLWGLTFDVFERDAAGYLVKTGVKIIKPAIKPLSKWIDRPKGVEVFPPMNGWQVYTGEARLDSQAVGSLAYLMCDSNDIYHQNLTILTSGPNQHGHGWSILPVNFARSIFCFAVRRLPKATWLNDQDEFDVPDTMHPAYAQFMLDCVPYALFHGSNCTSSLGNVKYKNKTYDIPNHFYWITPAAFAAIPDIPKLLYGQTHQAPVPFVAAWLVDNYSKLSPDAQKVIDLGKQLVIDSMHLRAGSRAIYQLGSRWDAGWYQIRAGLYGIQRQKPNMKPLARPTEQMNKTMGEFKAAYVALADRLRPVVYELGCLSK